MSLLRKIGLGKLLKGDLELISIHIPKSGGTSFRNTLRDVYGSHHVSRLDIGLGNKKNEVRVEKDPWDSKKFPKGIKVIHGHFSYRKLTNLMEVNPDVPVITWFRDPVERVISNYFYLSEQLHNHLDEDKKGLNILSKLKRSLVEYAQADSNRNRISKFMDGLSLEDLLFVGIIEHYNEDLQALSGLLKWNQDIKPLHQNPTSTKREVSEKERTIIRELNAKDQILFENAIKLRKARIQS